MLEHQDALQARLDAGLTMRTFCLDLSSKPVLEIKPGKTSKDERASPGVDQKQLEQPRTGA